MKFSAGLILLFLNVFLPGLLFLRFYSIGEFSKQFSTKIPLLRLAFYALMPGLLFQSISIYIYSRFDRNFTTYEALAIFNELSTAGTTYSQNTTYFLNDQLSNYLWYTILVCVFSSLLGFSIHYLIRRMRWDIKFNVLRFRNHWYYIFSGEILSFEKFKVAMQGVYIDRPKTNIYHQTSKYILSYVNIVVKEHSDVNMYSGFVVDYELDANDSHKLDKLYLMEAKKHDLPSSNGIFERSNKTKIPGDLFIIERDQILNMNITYVPLTLLGQIKFLKRKKVRNLQIVVTQVIMSVLLLFFIVQNIFRFELLNFNLFFDKFNYFEKAFFILTSYNLISLLSNKDRVARRFAQNDLNISDREKNKISRFVSKFVVVFNVIFLGISFYIIFRKLY